MSTDPRPKPEQQEDVRKAVRQQYGEGGLAYLDNLRRLGPSENVQEALADLEERTVKSWRQRGVGI